MVRGLSIAVTAVPRMYQCADTAKIAFGLGSDSPRRRQASVYWLWTSVFMGLPCPKNTAGIRDPLPVTTLFLDLYSYVDEAGAN
jgi:hypothetical protein